MTNPSHPGDLVWYGILEPLGVSVTRAAALLGVRRATLSDVVNGKASMSAEMAFRLHKAFGVEADLLLRMQNQFDLAEIRARAKDIKVKRYQRKAA
ncbi:MAG TPA: HigA family addiction module antitoxin [Rhizomicrobium sp.]|jgi:addiction module HigA family antidote|nr:HigA family addiction module antitoxin [Rhizomicrobium sp.]